MQSIRSSVEVVIFDLGGVLINIDFSRTLAHWAAGSGLSYAQLHERYDLDAYYHQHERGEIDASAYFASLRASLAVDLTDEQFHQGWQALLLDQVTGIGPLLERVAAQVPMVLFSNTNPAHFEVVMQRHGEMLAQFNKLFVSYEIGLRKPEAHAYRAVLADLGVNASQALFFDDTAQNIEAARALGLQAVQVATVDDVRQGLELAGL